MYYEIRQDDWLEGIMDSDSNDDEIIGFNPEWKTVNFDPRFRRSCRAVGAATVQHVIIFT